MVLLGPALGEPCTDLTGSTTMSACAGLHWIELGAVCSYSCRCCWVVLRTRHRLVVVVKTVHSTLSWTDKGFTGCVC